MAWQAAQGVLDAMLITGAALLLPVAVLLCDFALRGGQSTFLGWGSVVLGTAGIAGGVVAAATHPPTMVVAISILGTLAFHLVAGIRWLRLFRS